MSTATDEAVDFDPWGTDTSSGFLTDYEGTVTDAYYATDPNYNQGQTLLLHLVTSIDDAEDIPIDQATNQPLEELTQKYPCGANWLTEDGGRTAVHQTANPNKRFHASSLVGKIVDEFTGAVKNYGNAKNADGGAVQTNFDGIMDVIRDRGMPQDADVWKGLRFRFADVEFDYGPDKKANDGTRITSRRSMPVEFLGLADDGEKAKAPAKKAAAKKEAAPKGDTVDKVAEAKAKAAAKKAEAEGGDEAADPAAAVNALLDSLEPEVAEETKLAVIGVLTEAEDHDTFMNGALEVDGVVEHDTLVEAIVDADGGLWAAAGKNG